MKRRMVILFSLFLLTSWIIAGCTSTSAAEGSYEDGSTPTAATGAAFTPDGGTVTASASDTSSPEKYTITAIAAGWDHICLLTDRGAVKCAGRNDWGMLGDGTKVNRNRFVDVIGLSSGAKAISAYQSQTCAVMQSGTVKCWGANVLGELGDGSTEDRTQPVDVVGLEGDALAVAAGLLHTCALMKNGGVKCWGGNRSGQLGNGSLEDSSTPVDVIGLSENAVAISAGVKQTCIINTLQGVECWGEMVQNNADSPFTQNTRAVPIVGIKQGVRAIAVGGHHACVLMDGGEILCWGPNDQGQLGNPLSGSTATPVRATRITGELASISAGLFNTCALRSDGGFICWGYLADVFGYEFPIPGQIRFTGEPMNLDPSDLKGKAVSLSAGICALMADGAIKCLGSSFAGWEATSETKIVEIPQ